MANPIKPSDLFDEGLKDGVDAIVSALTQSLGTIEGKIKSLQKTAEELNASFNKPKASPVSGDDARRAQQLNDEFKALLQTYGIYKSEISQVTSVARDQNVILKLQAQYAQSAEGSYNKLSAEYRLLKAAMNEMGTVEEGEIKRLELMKKRANELYSAMNTYQKQTGKYTLQVGDYSRALNGLSLSTQQVLREMPTLANSMQQFFMAISNNVPIFVDNFKRARVVMGSTKAAFKGVLTSVLSWQTALLALLTILPKVAKSIQDKKKAQEEENKVVKEAFNATKELNKAEQEATQSATKSVAELKTLQSISKDMTRTDKERAEAMRLLNSKYPEASKNIDEYISKLESEARAKAYLAKVTEIMSKQVDIEVEKSRILTKIEAKRIELQTALISKQNASARVLGETQDAYNARQLIAAQNVEKVTKAIEESQQAIIDLDKQYADAGALIGTLTQKIDPVALDSANKTGAKNAGEDFFQTYFEGIIEQVENPELKEKLSAIFSFESEISGYRKELATNTNLTKQEITYITGIIDNLTKEREQKLTDITKKYQEERLKNWEKLKKEYTVAVEPETIEEDFVSIIDSSEQALARLSTQVVNASEAIRDEMVTGNGIVNKKDLESYQELLRKKLEAEREYQTMLAQLKYEGDDSKLEIETAKINATFDKAIANVGKSSKKKKVSIWGLLFGKSLGEDFNADTGVKELSQVQEAFFSQVGKAFSTGVSYINDYIGSLKELAEQAVETARIQAESAKSALEIEQQARANGYANNVELARKEYEEKLALQKDANKQVLELERVQQAANTVSQTSSLITATAALLSSYSAIPIVGLPLAIAAIATMFGAFAAAKIKAAQVTKTATYGDGMSEYLDYGGSHSSGNDIDFGTTKNGTRRRVERGEVVGVINKRNVAKYGASTVTGIIDSLNRGTFQNDYGNAFSGVTVNEQSAANLSKLENGVSAIVKQGEYKETIVGNKRIVQHKNVRRVITNA